MDLTRLSRDNGRWGEVWKQWDQLCSDYNEDFSDYAPETFKVLTPLADEPQVQSRGVFGLMEGDTCHAICQLNVAGLPGYKAKVLRTRHIVLSPMFDFDDVAEEQYAEVLGSIFASTLRISEQEMPSGHVKMHVHRPLDKRFFNSIARRLEGSDKFEGVRFKGSWLYLDKR